jgi:transcriptional regulator with XRE-family HTH domain
VVQNESLPRTLATRQTDTPPGQALARYIGTVLRKARVEQSLTITQVAQRAELSRGMLSKIETGQVASSLESLSRLTEALGITFSQIFRDYDAPEGGAQVVRSGEGLEVVRRGTRRGHTYHMLALNRGYKKNFEPFLISLDDESEAFPTFQHEGTQFIHILEGRMEYRHGKQIYALETGDSITFDAHVPHGPERLLEVPIRFLAVTVFDAP